MPIPSTKIFLSSAVVSSGYRLLSNDVGDLTQTVSSIPVSPWVAGLSDLNGDGIADFVVGGPGDDDKDVNAGRIYVRYGVATSGGTSVLPDSINGMVIDGVNLGDLAGSAIGSMTDMAKLINT
ncbi:MAG TPA: integrin alpha [Alphaproteobacteria bacterium]|nr:integrin alpha [Alphaproteobacteria bacterium]